MSKSLIQAAVLLSLTALSASATAGLEYHQRVDTLRVTATSAAPQLEASVSALAFGAVAVGETSSLQVTLTNRGGAPAALAAPLISGARFAASSSCGPSLSAGASCLTEVTFSPLSASASSGSVTFGSSSGGAPLVVSLSGTGVQAEGHLTANTSASFGTVAPGATVQRTFTFRNTGTAAASGVYATLGSVAGLSLAGNTCGTPASPGTVAAGQTCTLTASWTPTAQGALSAQLSVVSSAPNSPNSVTLSGTAAYASTSYVPFDGSIQDVDAGASSTFTNIFGTGTLGTGALSTEQAVTGGSSMRFTSSGSGTTLYTNAGGVMFPANAGLAFGTGDFTVSLKAYRTTGTNDYSGTLLSLRDAGNRFIVNVDDVGTTVSRFGVFLGSSGYYASNVNVQLNTWYDILVTRRAGQVEVRINGVLQPLYTSSGTLLGNAVQNTVSFGGTPRLVIGNQAGNAADVPRMWRGYIDEVRVYRNDITGP